MPSSNLHVLITRPEKAGRALAQQLENSTINSYCQPFFSYQTLASVIATQQLVNKFPNALVIFVSVAAVEFAHAAFPLSQWENCQFIAVGSATQQALKHLKINAMVPNIHTSEGLLGLAIFDHVENKDIIIVRGDGGREHLAQELQQRGANVHYLESYQRAWYQLDQNHVQHWKNQQINCIVVTSNALLESIVHLIKNSDSYWKNTCLWVVASKRIATKAKTLGLQNIINADGANDQAIITAITAYGKANDRQE
jgi:uroporphyrinogen-III synthase